MLLTARHDDDVSHPPLPQLVGMVQAGLEVWRWCPVVLSRPKNDDGLHRASLVLTGLPPDQAQVDGHVQQRASQHAYCQPDGPAERHLYEPAPPSSVARATRNRLRVRSRPNTSRDSNSGGPTRRPVTANRTGACTLPSCGTPTFDPTS